jgi:hypothetical protein
MNFIGEVFAPAVFAGIEVLFLGVFIFTFISYFLRGLSTASFLGLYLLNGIIVMILAAAVLTLVFTAPAGDDPYCRRLAQDGQESHDQH